jgi:DNA-binding CsgD family transcriptional regulator
MGSAHLWPGDGARLLRLIGEGMDDEPGAAMPWAVLEGLHSLIPCDRDVSYRHYSPHERRCILTQTLAGDGERTLRQAEGVTVAGDFWRLWWSSVCAYPQRTGDLRSVVHTGDFFATERARRQDVTAQLVPGARHVLIVSLPAPPQEVRRIVLTRSSGPAFDERDRQLATLLRPHLQEIWLSAEQRRRATACLSVREWEVLQKAAAGLSYADIADDLCVAVSTVRKHMEHVRQRLGVHTAAAAVAAAAHLSPPPPPDGYGSGGRTRR